MEDLKLEAVAYQKEEKYHRVTLLSETRQAVDEMYQIFDRIYDADPTGPMVYWLVDSSQINELPFRYMSQKTKRWRDERETRPNSRTAVLYQQNPLMATLLNMVINYFDQDQSPTKIFPPEKPDDAIAWLLSE